MEECLDLLCSDIDYTLGIFRSNWAQALMICKFFRDLGENIDRKEYSREFVRLDYESFVITPFFRLDKLIDDKIFWEATQHLFSFVEVSYNFCAHDLIAAIKLYKDKSVDFDKNHREIAEGYLDELKEKEKQSHLYYNILIELLNIASILERERFSFRRLKEFKSQNEVQVSVERLKKEFASKLRK